MEKKTPWGHRVTAGLTQLGRYQVDQEPGLLAKQEHFPKSSQREYEYI